MAHYAKVNNGIVERVIVAEAEFFDTFVDDSPGEWIEVYPDANSEANKRYNFCGIGDNYNKTANALYAVKPYSSWVLNETSYIWDCPVAYPDDDKEYSWNETDQTWDEV
jgi:hypothetical protein